MKTKDEGTTQHEKTPMFKINFTNLQKAAFPGPLTETDYIQAKVGDYFVRGKNIFKVVELERAEFSDAQHTLITKNANLRSNKAIELCNKYSKSGKYGVCIMYLECVLRNKDLPKRKVRIRVNELYNYFGKRYTVDYQCMSLSGILTKNANDISRTITSINISTKKLADQEARRIALLKLVSDTEKQPENEIVTSTPEESLQNQDQSSF